MQTQTKQQTTDQMFRDTRTLKAQVEYVLEKNEQTRNSDTELMIEIWKQFYSQHLLDNKTAIRLSSLHSVPNQDDVKRIRAKIQNDPKSPRFLPTSWEVAKQRNIREEVWKELMGHKNSLF